MRHVDPEVVLEIGKVSPGGSGGYVSIEHKHETRAVVAEINLIGFGQFFQLEFGSQFDFVLDFVFASTFLIEIRIRDRIDNFTGHRVNEIHGAIRHAKLS